MKIQIRIKIDFDDYFEDYFVIHQLLIINYQSIQIAYLFILLYAGCKNTFEPLTNDLLPGAIYTRITYNCH